MNGQKPKQMVIKAGGKLGQHLMSLAKTLIKLTSHQMRKTEHSLDLT